jgi:hypothetical protein
MSTEPDPPSYGVLERRQLSDAIDALVEEIDVLGFTVTDSGLDPAKLETIRVRMDGGLADQAAASGEEVLKADEDILRCPLADDDLFLEVATLPPVLEVCRRILGENLVLLQQNGILNRPSTPQYQSRWHRDLPYQHFVGSQKLAVNALLCVDDFTTRTGGTVVLPGSHMFGPFPSARLVRRHEMVVEAKAGSVIMMDAMLYHRAGANVSPRVRRGLNHLIGRPLLAQQIDIPRLLEGRHSDDPFLDGYLGYRWNPAVSVAEWRTRRL